MLTHNAEEAHGHEGLQTHEKMESTQVLPTVQNFAHTELLNGDANDVWEACKHAVALLPDLAPHYFAKAEFDKGSGLPGSISIIHFAPPGAGFVKQRIDRVDNQTRTLSYTVIDGYSTSSYSSFNAAELKFTPTSDKKTEATWIATYETVGDLAGPPEDVKKMVIMTLKTLEKAAIEKRVVRHTRTLEAPADTIWNILIREDVILPKAIPHIMASIEFLEGNGEVGSIRLLKFGHAIPGGMEVIERIDMNDSATRTWAYTVLQGDPKYTYLSAEMQFLPGEKKGTTLAKWVGVYVPRNASVPPPDLVLHVWKVFENVVKTHPEAVY